MILRTRFTLAMGALACAASVSTSTAQRLLIPDSAGGVVMEFDPFTGSLVHPAAIDLGSVT